MRQRSNPSIVFVVLALLLATGCTPEPTPLPSPSATAAGPEAPSQERLEQTLWTLADDPDGQGGEALPDDDPDVQAVRKAAALYSDLIDHRSWDSLEDSLEAEYTYYSASAMESLGDQYSDKVREMFAKDRLRLEPVNVSWLRSSISEDRSSAVASLSSTFQFTEASDAFQAERGLATGVSYVEARRIYLSKIEGEWMIDRVERQPIEEARSSKP